MNNLFIEHSDHPLFRFLDAGERTVMEGIGRVVELGDGEELIRSGARDTQLYTVEQGVLEIADSGGRVLASVGPGDVLGEVSFIDDSPRSASVRAAAPAVLRAWDRDSLMQALQSEPAILAKFSVALNLLLVERLRDTAKAGVVSRR
ncbi:MAG TPA: cyclic nucleotide-binding domain-containing protein [Thermoanaerobaculia bacterium]|nr:cyclic nucleotide-binding domain-containing protein [Thermoanaerobaculia bacterium]